MSSRKLSEKQQSQFDQLSKSLLSELQVSDHSSWLKTKQIMLRILEIVTELPELLKIDLRFQLRKINSLLTLLFIFSQDIPKLRETNYFRQQFITLKKKGKCYEDINLWLAKQKQQIEHLTIEFILQNLPAFFIKEMKIVIFQDFLFLLTIFNRFRLKSDKQINLLMSFTTKLQIIELSSTGSLGIKQLSLLKIICKVLQNEEGTGNLGILFDEALIGSPQLKYIDKFCNLQSEYLLSLSAEKLQSIFKNLCKVGINYLILDFLFQTSRILANEQQFYKLKYLYEKLILPQIAIRAKTSKKPKVDGLVLTLTEFYFYGFFVNYKLQKSALQCLLAHIQQVKSKDIQARWIWLCQKAVQKNDQKLLTTFLQQQIANKGLHKLRMQTKECEKVVSQYQVWQITQKNIRNLKKYNYQLSADLKGITNHSAQCYIISIVQALFMTKSLAIIAQKVYSRYASYGAIYNLKNIFEELANNTKYLPSVDFLKKDGPKQFSRSQHQQDAQNYLISLMQQLQEQFKKENLLKEFKQIFEIHTKDLITCRSCKYETQNVQYQYAHTFAHGEEFVLQRSQNLLDYKCDKCAKMYCKKTTIINLTSKIAILHINRFSSKGGASKKELTTQAIKRRINDYQLVGMVFHIGKAMQSGHYTYFSRIDRKRWAQMNDSQVFQFNLDVQDQEFQKQFKAEKTPYILFYKKTSAKS